MKHIVINGRMYTVTNKKHEWYTRQIERTVQELGVNNIKKAFRDEKYTPVDEYLLVDDPAHEFTAGSSVIIARQRCVICGRFVTGTGDVCNGCKERIEL